jgi:hypothetical protein
MSPRGSWLCENAKTFDGDRSYSSNTVVTVKLAGELNFNDKLQNLILAAFRSFAFLHSQGQNRTSPLESEAICLTSIELCERDQLSVPPNDLRPPFQVHLGYHIPKARQDRAC